MKLSFGQWQVWAVLACAVLCGSLSVNLHYLGKDQHAVDLLIGELTRLERDGSAADWQHPGRWLVEMHQLMPEIERHARRSAARLNDPLNDLTQKLTRGGAAGPAEQLEVRQHLAMTLAELRSASLRIGAAQSQYTHFYYLSVIGFVIAVAALLMRQRNLRAFSPLQQLLADRLLFAHAPVALSVSDAQDRLLRANSAFEKVTGFESDELQGRVAVCEDSAEEAAVAQNMRAALAEEGFWTGEYRLRRKDGSVNVEKVMRMAVGEDTDAPEGYLTIAMEPVVSDEEQRLMLWQAHHDNLTKLPNANLLHERLARAAQQEKRGAVISIDLDGFKHVNDSVGHANADRILTDAALRIAMSARETDTVARMGSDHFVIMLPEIEEVAEVERVTRSAIEAFSAPFFVAEQELFIGVSAGVTIFPDDGRDKGELLQKADAARLLAKARGGNQAMFFEEQMNTVAARRFEIESRLRKAIAAGELELHYQPIIDISHDSVYGAEALLRWQNPDLGFVSPGEFIPVAEDSGLIVEIGRWVVEEVQQQLDAWGEVMPDLKVSLNVSARQFANADQAEELLDVLGCTRTDQITVELTESAVVDDAPGGVAFLQGLRALGLKIALDDFGTGYSSVGYLKDYEFDVLKVDKSFIDGIDGVRDLGLVASIVAMGRILGMRVVAEGVEEQGQVERLKRIGCDFVQGYYYSRPLPAADFAAFVAAQRDADEDASRQESA